MERAPVPFYGKVIPDEKDLTTMNTNQVVM